MVNIPPIKMVIWSMVYAIVLPAFRKKWKWLIRNLEYWKWMKLITPEMHQLHQYPALSQYSFWQLKTWQPWRLQVVHLQFVQLKEVRAVAVELRWKLARVYIIHIYIYTDYILYSALSQYSKFSLNIYLANWAGHTHVTNNWLMPVGG